MIRKSVIFQFISAILATSFMVGAFTYSVIRMTPETSTLDLSAFKNLAANIDHIRNVNENKSVGNEILITETIINIIEKEIKASHRPMMKINPVKKLATVKRSNFITSTPKSRERKITDNFEINNKEMISLRSFKDDRKNVQMFANIEIPTIEEDRVITVQSAVAPTEDELLAEEYAEFKKEIEIENVTKVAEQSQKDNDQIEIKKAEEVKLVSGDEIKTDEVKVAQASTQEGVVTENDEDLVVYDYSNKQAEVNAQQVEKVFDRPISSSVKLAIERELHKNLAKPTATAIGRKVVNEQVQVESSEGVVESSDDILKQALASEESTVYDYSTSAMAAPTETRAQGFLGTTKADDITTVTFKIRAKEINLNTQKVKTAIGYEFVPDYDRTERSDDQTSGEITLGYSLAETTSTQTGVIQSIGMIPTRVELNLADQGIVVPLINEEGIQKYLQKRGLDIVGNLVMSAIDNSISDVELDSEYQAKIFLTKNLKTLTTKDGADYVLFLGVKTGNVLLKYLLANKESAQKIIYVGDGEMYFENPDFVSGQRELYTLTTRSLLGKKIKELNIDAGMVSFFGSKSSSKKRALNAYELKAPEMIYGTRKYLEFKHLGSTLFMGVNNSTELEVPSEDFIGKVLEVNQLSDLGERCMVQINLSRDIRDIKIGGKNRSGEMFVETTYLDRDGNFSRENSELAEKVFIVGDLEGIFNTRMEYTDGSVEFLKTYCSEGSYIVEEL